MDLRLGFFASGKGSNVEAIINNYNSGNLEASPKVIITNNKSGGVLDVAEKNNIANYVLNDKNIPKQYNSIEMRTHPIQPSNKIHRTGYN
jgi:folate-dependent phosphoribosylglycinamide formyltransferase PurN